MTFTALLYQFGLFSWGCGGCSYPLQAGVLMSVQSTLEPFAGGIGIVDPVRALMPFVLSVELMLLS